MILTAANCVIAFERNQTSSLQLHMSAHARTWLLCRLCQRSWVMGVSFPPSLPISSPAVRLTCGLSFPQVSHLISR